MVSVNMVDDRETKIEKKKKKERKQKE